MIIDIHTHVFPEKIAATAIDKLSMAAHISPYIEATADRLVQTMAKAGVDLSVIQPVATAERQVEKLNDAAARLNEAHSGLFSFGAMHPDYEGWHDELARIKRLGLKGIKLHPIYQGVDIDDIRFLRILDRTAELGLIVLTHAGYDVGFPGVVHVSPAMCRHAVEKVGPFDFILAHMGGWRNWDEVPEILAGTGVYIDTAFSTGFMDPLDDGYWTEEDLPMLDRAGALRIIRAIGPDHVLFGSDSPWSSQEDSLRFLKDLARPAADPEEAGLEEPLTEEELAGILGENARQLLAEH